MYEQFLEKNTQDNLGVEKLNIGKLEKYENRIFQEY